MELVGPVRVTLDSDFIADGELEPWTGRQGSVGHHQPLKLVCSDDQGAVLVVVRELVENRKFVLLGQA